MSRTSKAFIAGAFEHPIHKAIDEMIPQLHAEVALGALQDERASMMINIIDCDVDSEAIGQAVEVTFRVTEGDRALPVFRPIDDLG